MSKASVSVIIICYNQLQYIKKTIALLQCQKYAGRIEIIVVDSGSVDGTREYLKKIGIFCVHIDNKDFKYPNAFNMGSRHANGEFIIRLSGDVVPLDTNFIFQLLALFQRQDVAATYGKYVCLNGKKQLPFAWPESRFSKTQMVFRVRPSFLFLKNIIDGSFLEMRNLAGGCCAFRASVFRKRRFNENVLEGEDAEYAMYLHHKGLKIGFNPKAVVIHEHTRHALTARRILRMCVVWCILLVEFYKMNLKYFFTTQSVG